MDILTVLPTTWRGQPAWRVHARRLDLVITVIGGHLASLCERGETLNPLWQPPWPAVDPSGVEPGSAWGAGAEAKLLATIVGHNWCADRFGPAWPGETRPVHGEIAIVTWRLSQPTPSTVQLDAWLPEAQLRARQTYSVQDRAVLIDHALAHDDARARAVEWCEHVNIGDPFLDGVEFTAGIDRVVNWPNAAEPGSRFADIAPEGEIDIATALAFPARDAAPCGDVTLGRVRRGWWSATNRRLRHRLTYQWDPSDYPWLALWTQHRSRTATPWNGTTRSRGMEFSSKPWPEGQPPASRAERYLGCSTQCLVPPGAWRTQRMTVFWERC